MLSKWSETLERPSCMWISGMFNPTAYLTSILQATGRNTGWALDKMAIETHVTIMTDPSAVTEQPHNGVFVHGIFMEGARWPTGDDLDENGGQYDVDGTKCGGAITDGRLKELLSALKSANQSVLSKTTRSLLPSESSSWEAQYIHISRDFE